MSYHRACLHCDKCGVALTAVSRIVRILRRIAEGWDWRVATQGSAYSPLHTDLDYCPACKDGVE